MKINREPLRKAINDLMVHFGIKDAADLAKKCDTSEKLAVEWMKGFYDPIKIYQKYGKEISAEWILTGSGEMLKGNHKGERIVDNNPTVIELLKKENTRLEESLKKAEERYDKLLEKFLSK